MLPLGNDTRVKPEQPEKPRGGSWEISIFRQAKKAFMRKTGMTGKQFRKFLKANKRREQRRP